MNRFDTIINKNDLPNGIVTKLLVLCFVLQPLLTFANPITEENLNVGSRGWALSPGWDTAHAANDSVGQIKGYLSATSVNKGGQISFRISVNPAQNFTIEIYRAGWYGGNGGRLMQVVGPMAGIKQPDCGPLGTPSDVLEECNWSNTYTLTVPATWTSGIYLAKLKNASGFDSGAIFVVRDDTRQADYLYKQPVHTYQAYNDYPSQLGKSLYTATKAYKISYNRPYAGSPTNSNGYGDYILFELELVKWLEKEGYDVNYTTDVDFQTNGGGLLNYRALLSPGHDEYWTKEIRDGVEAARNNGVNLAFFGANAAYLQVRLEPSPIDQSPNRTLVCYKSSILDPIQDPALKTDLFRSPAVNRPEQQLMGIQFGSSNALGRASTYTSLITNNTSNWVYRGSGIVDGQSFPGLVGYEVDFQYANYAKPQSTEYTLLAQSPFLNSNNITVQQQTVIFKTLQGGWVFSSGTMAWSWGLDYDTSYPFFGDKRSAALQTVTKNIMNRFGGYNDLPSGQPVITGLAQENQTLAVDMSGVSDFNGLGVFAYQWQRNGVNISGATGNAYNLVDADVGAQIRLVATYTDGWDKLETVISTPTVTVANINDLPSGVVNISGNPTVGATLTADNTLTDADGLGTISYQWQRNGVNIAGATGSSYILSSNDAGTQINVIAKYADNNGTVEQVASATVTIAAASNHPPIGTPVINGIVQENQILTANTSGISDSDGLGAFAYQWQRNGVNIAGATGATYGLGDPDVGSVIAVLVSYTDGLGKVESLISTSTPAVANVNDLPSGSVVITGIPNIGKALTVTNTITDADGLGAAINYQWRRNGANISGATANTYVLVAADAGTQISVSASYADGFGTAEKVNSANVNIPVFLGVKRLRNVYYSTCAYPSSTSENARLYITGCSSSSSQKWNIEQIDSTTFKLANQSTGKVIAVNNGSTSSGAAIVQQTVITGANHQLWNIASASGSSFNLINKKSGICLSVDMFSRALSQRSCSTSNIMRWSLIN